MNFLHFLRLLGAMGILVGCGLLCAGVVHRERRHIRTLRGLSDGLIAMAQMLELSAPPMEELLEAAQRADRTTAEYFGRISLDNLEKHTLSDQWRRIAGDITLLLNEDEKRCFSAPGQVLGRCGGDEQSACLRAAAAELEQRAVRRQAALEREQRLWYTLALSAGALGVVLLL